MADLQKFCDELRAKISIADVVGAKVKLTRKGREYTGLCPFHNEKTPSFTVNEAKGFYHCFGCGAHGDIIKFEMEANGLTFIDAVEKLAHKVGMELPKLTPESQAQVEKRNSLYDIMEFAAKFFEKSLRMPEGRNGLDYLYRRGFDDEIINKFRLGFAPNNNGLRAQLSSKGITDQEMAELGLISIPEDKNRRPHDFFRERVMIPIMDKRGRVIAFGGRLMGDGQPKYLNSPETPIFNKRRVLYNLNYARDKGYENKALIICEGYMDVIAMDKFGINYAVAPLGTALTEDQILEAWKVVNEPTCCFDGDSAGVRAAVRSVDRVLPILKPGYSLKYAFLPDKQDPDEYLKAHGREGFLKVVNDTMPLKDLLWKKNIDLMPTLQTPEQKALFEKNIREEVAKIADETVKGYYAQDMQERIYDELGRGAWKQRQNASREANTYSRENNRGNYNRSAYGKNRYQEERPKVSLVGTIKTNLDDLGAQYVVSALYCYPNLLDEYEERLLGFEIKNKELKDLLDLMFEAAHECESGLDSTKIQEFLDNRQKSDAVKKLLETKMMQRQNHDVITMRKHLDVKIVESQLKQIDCEIRDCLAKLEGDSFSEDVYNRYESLKKERESLINTEYPD